MAKHYHPKKLLVEGQDDLRVIPELIEKNGIYWGAKKRKQLYQFKNVEVMKILLMT